MVGTRKPTAEGSGHAQAFARELASRGWCIVSGMALGVDGVAQRAALAAGGHSIAVLGCGVDVIYPARHRELHEQLSTQPGGLLLSEHPPGTVVRPAFFHAVTASSQGFRWEPWWSKPPRKAARW